MKNSVMVRLRRDLRTVREADTSTPNAERRTPLCFRALVSILVPLSILLACRWLLNGGGLLCRFYELTGLYCPGCGSGRAALALLRGHMPEAFSHNALLFVLGVPCAVLLGREYLRFVFPGLSLKKIELPAWTARLSLGMIVVFWVLRNVPGFEILAP